MQKSKSRGLVAALMIAGVIAGQFAVIGSAEARRAKCASVPVPGHAGTFVVVCSTKRP
ncbi:MAG TPA: hypothetical protein VI139_06520 [Gemmatimonadales bacterium]|nr:hypothetical protein [Usitatibacter sp.]